MPLVQMKDMLLHAHAHRYAVGAFDLVSLDFLEGILAAVERCRAPVILSLAESHFEYLDFELLMPAVETAAGRASVPVAIHLDHGANLKSAVSAINRRCSEVMVDASDRPFDENLRLTREVVAMAHFCGVPVEGELGYVPVSKARTPSAIPVRSPIRRSRRPGALSRRRASISWRSPSVRCMGACGASPSSIICVCSRSTRNWESLW